LDLRGYRIPYLENLAATNDQYACIDLTDNDITKIEELPQLLRLETLMLANNRISRISKDFAAVCPRLDTLILSGNRLTSFAELDNLPKLIKRLVCMDNVVFNLPNYRLYVVFRFPQLKMLDY
jgi:U2 small nuclear ribonucleoprotein A'